MYPLQDHIGSIHGIEPTINSMKGEPLLGAHGAVRAWIQQPQDLAAIAQSYGR